MNELATMNQMNQQIAIGIQQALDLPAFEPEATGKIVQHGHMSTILNMIRTGKALQQGKDVLGSGGDYTDWVTNVCGLGESTARKYKSVYNRFEENKELVLGLDSDVQKEVLTLSNKLFKEFKEEAENSLEDAVEKLKGTKKLLQIENKELKEEIEEGSQQNDALRNKNYELSQKIEDLKQPDKLNEERLRTAQELMNEVTLILKKAARIEIDPHDSHSLLANPSVALKELSDKWTENGTSN